MAPNTIETLRLLVVSSEVSVLRLLGSTAQSNSWHLETSASGWDAMERVQSDSAPICCSWISLEATATVFTCYRGCEGFAPSFRSSCSATARMRTGRKRRPAWARRAC